MIWAAWRAFWVGLGASLVLIAQSVLVPAGSQAARVEQPAMEMPAVEMHVAPIAAPVRPLKSGAPILSRNPFDSRARLAPHAS